MAHTLNLAEKWQPGHIAIINQNTLSAPFLTSNVDWLSAKTFHFTQMSVSGYKPHSQDGGWNSGTITQLDVPYTLTHDRDIEFLIDKRQVDETNSTASIQSTSEIFTQTNQAPEVDAFFYSKVATEAVTAGLTDTTDIGTFTTGNVYGRIKTALTNGKLRLYKQRGSLVIYLNSTLMDLLEQATDFVREIEMTQVSSDGLGIQTRVSSIDGIPLIEVIDDNRFWDAFDFTDGFVPATGSFAINFLIASLETVKTVPKINSIYAFAPGDHTTGDGWLYQNRAFWDTFVFPNGLDNVIDSIYVSLDDTPTP